MTLSTQPPSFHRNPVLVAALIGVLVNPAAWAQTSFQTRTAAEPPVLAQPPAAAPVQAPLKSDTAISSIASEREKTLGRVNDVTADKPQPFDSTFQLARTRQSESTALSGIAKEAMPTKPRDSAAPPMTQGWALGTLPTIETAAPGPQRLIKRQAPALTEEGSGKPQYTPDFSRQKAQLAELAGRIVVDLPRLEINSAGKTTLASAAAKTPQEWDALTSQAWSMADVVNVGLASSTVLQSSGAQLQAAADRTGQARADYFPTLSARIAKGHENSTTLGSATDAHIYEAKALRLAVPIYNRSVHQNHLSAQKQEQYARLKQQAAQETVALSLAKATIDVAMSRLNLDFSDELLAQMNQILNYVDVRTQSGVTSQADLERARTRLLTATQGRLDLQATYKTALYEMERLVGQSPAALRLPMLNALPGLPTTKAEMRQLTRDHNADILALRENVAAQEAAIAAISGKVLPTVGLSLENDVNTNISTTSPELHNKRALVVLAWGASMGGKEVYAESEARAELRNRMAQLDEETQKIEQAIEADFALLQSATLRISAGQSEQVAAARVTESVKEQIKTGRMGSLLDALDASERLYSARSRVVLALGQQMQAQAQLLRWLGSLSQIRNSANLSLDTGSTVSSLKK